LRLSTRRIHTLEDDAGPANENLVPNVQLALVDRSAVDLRGGLVAEVDQRDLVGPPHLDDRMHARRELIFDLKMTLGVLTNLDDVLPNRFSSDELIALIEGKSENCF
jgi:hypothetical protein